MTTLLWFLIVIILILSAKPAHGGSCGSKPTLPNLISFQRHHEAKRINIPQLIGIKFREFGILLLEDDQGSLVEIIIHERCSRAVDINLIILQKWLQGTGKPPTWSSLIEVLRDIELNVLANDIEQELASCNDYS